MAAVKMATSKNICIALGAPKLMSFLSINLSSTKNLMLVTNAFDFSFPFNKNHKYQTIIILDTSVP